VEQLLCAHLQVEEGMGMTATVKLNKWLQLSEPRWKAERGKWEYRRQRRKILPPYLVCNSLDEL
jgi:hypothetical protein